MTTVYLGVVNLTDRWKQEEDSVTVGVFSSEEKAQAAVDNYKAAFKIGDVRTQGIVYPAVIDQVDEDPTNHYIYELYESYEDGGEE